jgi:hypothetical protein
VVTAIFTVVAPGAAGTTGLRYLVLRWFHPLAWVILGLSAFVERVLTGGGRPAELMAQLALVVYAVYQFTFGTQRRRRAKGSRE